MPKNEFELRPVMDCTMGGVNAQLAPWGMSLPNIEVFLGVLKLDWLLCKRDLRHGFYHLTIHPKDRPYFGFKHPVTGKLGRFTVLTMGCS